MPKRESTNSKEYGGRIRIRNIDATQQSPLVLIVGWADGRSRHLAKYSSLYEAKGFTTLTMKCTTARTIVFYNPFWYIDCQAFINAMNTQRDRNKRRPILFHLFSAPGPCMYINVFNYYLRYIPGHFGMNRYRNEDLEDTLNVSGVIFDSASFESSRTIFVNAAMSAGKNKVSRWFLKRIASMTYSFTSRGRAHRGFGDYLRTSPVTVPHLFLYSKVDNVAGYEQIERFMEHKRSIGTGVSSVRFEESSHVAHYRKYKEGYETAIEEFLGLCLPGGFGAKTNSEPDADGLVNVAVEFPAE